MQLTSPQRSQTTKYIFVTGGVVSSLGKGLAAASIGALLECHGYKVTLQKFDPYINVDPGIFEQVFGLARTGRASLLAGTVTVALLVVPIMARGMDEVFKMVPPELQEASYALGSTRWETAVRVVLRQALPGLVAAYIDAIFAHTITH